MSLPAWVLKIRDKSEADMLADAPRSHARLEEALGLALDALSKIGEMIEAKPKPGHWVLWSRDSFLEINDIRKTAQLKIENLGG